MHASLPAGNLRELVDYGKRFPGKISYGSGGIGWAVAGSVGAAIGAHKRQVVAVIGDGAMTAGMAFEALNNGGVPHDGKLPNFLVILNDNDMSISPPVGALNKYLARLMSGKFYAAAREGAKSVLKNAPPLFMTYRSTMRPSNRACARSSAPAGSNAGCG